MNTYANILAWLVSVPCLAFWLFCVAVNPVLFVRREILRRPGAASVIPVVGGLAGAVGLLLVPVASLRGWYWMACLADIGAGPWLAYLLVSAGVAYARKSR